MYVIFVMKNYHFIIVLDLGCWYFIYGKQNFGFILRGILSLKNNLRSFPLFCTFGTISC